MSRHMLLSSWEMPGSEDVRMQLPIATIQSGPVNSLRGAAALTGVSDAIVLDIGRLLVPKPSYQQ